MRPDNWPTMLDAYIEHARGVAFEWGSHDCVTFTTGWHKAITGRDVFAPYRGRYHSSLQAMRLLTKHAAASMDNAGRVLFGLAHEKLTRHAQRGDIVLAADCMGNKALGICTGQAGAFIGPNDERVTFLPRVAFLNCWTV